METFRVVCINDRNKPVEVPAENWIEKNQVYTVLETASMYFQKLTTGYKLAEVSLPSNCQYKYYIANRFRLYDESDAEAEEAVESLIEEMKLVEL